jgi:ABC-type amino acid transport substrate-binding protein
MRSIFFNGTLKRMIAAATILVLPLAGAPASLAGEGRLQAVQERNTVQICIWPGYYAISFRNPRNGELQGIDIDMANALAADLRVGRRFVESTFATFMDDLQTEKCDVAMFAIGDTPARRERVDMSAPHLRSGMYAITSRSNTTIATWGDLDRAGQVIAVQKGTVMEPYMKDNLRNAKLTVVVPPGTREEELLAGRADAFMTDFPYAQRMRFQHDWAVVIAPPEPVAPTNYGYAVRKGEAAWLARVNAFVAAIKADGRLAKAAEKHGLSPIVVNQ